MKYMLLTLTVFGFLQTSHAAPVNSEKIKNVANQLDGLFPSSNESEVTPASPLNMMKEYAISEYEESGDDFNYDPEQALDPDSTAWGIIKMSQAISWVQSSQYLNQTSEGEEIKNSPTAKKAGNLIRSLVGTGVVFGAAPHGAVQCGVTFPALLLIDTKSGVIYSFNTEDSGC
jgi:hypothetical protein